YGHLKLPYAVPHAAEELPHQPDPTIADMMDIASDDGTQLGFVILREDNTLEIVDTVLGEHARVRLGERGGGKPPDRPIEPLIHGALIESKAISATLAEIIDYLERKEHLAALGTFQGLDEKFKFLGTVLEVVARRYGNFPRSTAP